MSKFVQPSQNQLIFGQVGHRSAVMLIADLAKFIDQEQSRDAPELEEIPFLAIKVGDGMLRVGQAGVRELIFAPVALVSGRAVGANGEDFRVTRGEGRIIIAQAREMGAAVRSQKAAQEDQNQVFSTFKSGEPDRRTGKILEFKIGGTGKRHHGV